MAKKHNTNAEVRDDKDITGVSADHVGNGTPKNIQISGKVVDIPVSKLRFVVYRIDDFDEDVQLIELPVIPFVNDGDGNWHFTITSDLVDTKRYRVTVFSIDHHAAMSTRFVYLENGPE